MGTWKEDNLLRVFKEDRDEYGTWIPGRGAYDYDDSTFVESTGIKAAYVMVAMPSADLSLLKEGKYLEEVPKKSVLFKYEDLEEVLKKAILLDAYPGLYEDYYSVNVFNHTSEPNPDQLRGAIDYFNQRAKRWSKERIFDEFISYKSKLSEKDLEEDFDLALLWVQVGLYDDNFYLIGWSCEYEYDSDYFDDMKVIKSGLVPSNSDYTKDFDVSFYDKGEDFFYPEPLLDVLFEDGAIKGDFKVEPLARKPLK